MPKSLNHTANELFQSVTDKLHLDENTVILIIASVIGIVGGFGAVGFRVLIELIQSLNNERNITLLLSSHNLHQVQKISHRVGIMIRGKMVAEGSIEALSREKFGLGEETYTLEEIYMKYFQEV